jgi:hypothetical protein
MLRDHGQRLPRPARPGNSADYEVGIASGLTKNDAEDFLDWLDAHGWSPFQVSDLTPEGYTIRYRRPSL